MKKLLLCGIVMLPLLAKAQCSATFTPAANPENNNLLQWSFTNNATPGSGLNAVTHYRIYFGDGAITTNTYPGNAINHNYSSPGSYTSSLVVKTYDSTNGTLLCSDSQAVSITVAYPACGVMVIDSQTTAPYAVPASFDFYSDMPGGSTGYSYSWSFGDGTSSTSANPSHTYNNPGTYTYCLTVTNAGGTCSYTNCGSVTVVPTPSCAVDSTEFYYSGTGLSIYFSAYPSYTPTFTNTNSWNFGDGSTAMGNFFNHTYSAPGAYPVTLITAWGDSAMGAVSCIDTFTSTVYVNYPVTGIAGNICHDSIVGVVNPQYRVWLIQFDSLTNLLYAVDSNDVGGYAGCASYSFYGMSGNANYLVKAQWTNNSGFAYGMVPTYSYSQLYWSSANQVYVSATGGTVQADIHMLNGTPTTGAGFVGGNVSYGANKGTNGGVANLLIVLRDASNNPVQSTFTDINGNYTFTSVPNGTYSVYPEQMNYATIPYNSITVNAAIPGATLIDFYQDDVQMNIAPHTEGITNIAAATVSAYPNPAGSIVNITVDVKALGYDARYELTTLNGQTAQNGKLSGGRPQISVAALSNGMYFLHVRGNKAQGSTKLVVQHP